jgi:hypothetical protein
MNLLFKYILNIILKNFMIIKYYEKIDKLAMATLLEIYSIN